MAEFVDLLHRDNTLGLYNDTSPRMHSPRMKGSHIFVGHPLTPSSVCQGMEEPLQAGLSPEVNYEDVFGGPPRFAALMSMPHLDRTPTATLQKTTARQLSLRTCSLPVFDLPVFGENAFGSTVYEAAAKSNAYDDTFDEEASMPDSLPAFNLNGNSRSRANSLSSSRRMSPVHPIVAVASQPGGDATLLVTNSAPNPKTRHSARPAAVKFSRRGSLSSASSFDEGSGKLGDGFFTCLRNDAVLSSLPSSPPQSSLSSHSKGSTGAAGSIGVGPSPTSAEVDDVFGGFPKRRYSQPLSAVPLDFRTSETHGTNAPETPRTEALEKAGQPSTNIENRFYGSSSAAHTSELSDTKICTFSRSSSVKSGPNGRDQHEIMDMPTNLPVLDTVQTFSGLVSNHHDDKHTTFQGSFRLPTPRPLISPTTELKFKSWKDLAASDRRPASLSDISSSIIDSVPDTMLPGMVTPGIFAKQQSDESFSAAQQNSEQSAAGYKGEVKSPEYTFDLEENELQALFANAWKINKLMESENYNAKFPEEAPKYSEVEEKETHLDEQTKQLGGQSKSSGIQQCNSVDLDERVDDINWKEWRKYGRRQRKEQSKALGLDDGSYIKDVDFKKQTSASDRTRGLAEMSVSFGVVESGNTKEHLRADPEEALMDCVSVSFEVSSNSLACVDSLKKASKGVSGHCTSREYLTNKQAVGKSDDVERVASFYNHLSEPSQDFVYNDEQNPVPLCVPVEEAECLIDLASCLDGFQEIEAEMCKEHRNSRWEQHSEPKAKAVEEMQHRHAELQHQQEEKHESSAALDGKVKRWAAGKEGNLRALLSNLQHVLWSECGWQSIPLAELIEVSDVKKAYRKATLFVHPDKVQQKGASIQQKYIAEKVFDILQEAWKTFNMEESF